VIGHFAAKGLHTNLLLQVSARRPVPRGATAQTASALRVRQVGVAEDCRFAFAGVLRGSAQMIAWDMSKLPTWASVKRSSAKFAVHDLIDAYVHSDAKLKGFGAATRVLNDSVVATAQVHTPGHRADCAPRAQENGAEYRLICGRGIKNIHIWRLFKPLQGEPGPSQSVCLIDDEIQIHHAGAPTWTLLYDTSTNGMTVELVGFRENGTVAFSRSKGYGLRLWELPAVVDASSATTCGPRAHQFPLLPHGAPALRSPPLRLRLAAYRVPSLVLRRRGHHFGAGLR
jgi:hypothetical protein